MGLKGKLLHVGSGGHKLPDWAEGADETTLDIDPGHNPDYVRSMTDMGDIGEYNIVYSCHCLEHVFPHEVKQTLKEMRRVLVKGGHNLVIVPDLTDVKPTKDIIYTCPTGPVCGLDIIYGYGLALEDHPHMAHKTGFTMQSLKDEFKEAGFKNISGTVIDDIHSIMVTGEK